MCEHKYRYDTGDNKGKLHMVYCIAVMHYFRFEGRAANLALVFEGPVLGPMKDRGPDRTGPQSWSCPKSYSIGPGPDILGWDQGPVLDQSGPVFLAYLRWNNFDS